jgi:hypothetical protein
MKHTLIAAVVLSPIACSKASRALVGSSEAALIGFPANTVASFVAVQNTNDKLAISARGMVGRPAYLRNSDVNRRTRMTYPLAGPLLPGRGGPLARTDV